MINLVELHVLAKEILAKGKIDFEEILKNEEIQKLVKSGEMDKLLNDPMASAILNNFGVKIEELKTFLKENVKVDETVEKTNDLKEELLKKGTNLKDEVLKRGTDMFNRRMEPCKKAETIEHAVYVSGEHVIVNVNVAGVNKEDIVISLTSKALNIKINRKGENPNYGNLKYGEIEGSILIPAVSLDENEIDYSLKYGILTVKLRKISEAVKINIK